MTQENHGIPAEEFVERIGLISWPDDLRITCTHGNRHTQLHLKHIDEQSNVTSLKDLFIGEAHKGTLAYELNIKVIRDAVLKLTKTDPHIFLKPQHLIAEATL